MINLQVVEISQVIYRGVKSNVHWVQAGIKQDAGHGGIPP